jgi:pyruvate-formate lyase-activating enzyme
VIERARRLGFPVLLMSNGWLATARMAPVLSELDSVAIDWSGVA